jgi:hypothetical protein
MLDWDSALKAGAAPPSAPSTPNWDEAVKPPAAPTPAAPAPPPGGSDLDPNWKPSGNGLIDFLMRPRAKTEGVGEALKDAGLSALDAGTFGYGVPNAWQGAAAQAHQNLGVLDPAVEAAAYTLGPGKILGPIARGAAGLTGLGATGAGLASRLGASAIGGGLETGAASGLGAAGHGGDASDIAEATAKGLATGGAVGLLGGSGPTPKAPGVGSPGTGSTPATGMYAEKNAAYAPLDKIYFDGKAYQQPLVNAWNTIAKTRDPQGLGVDLGVPQNVQDIVNKIGKTSVATGRNLQQASQDLRDTGDWTGHRFADALDSSLANAQPLTGGAPGDAMAAKQAGDLWHGRIQDLNRLDEPTKANVAKTQEFHPDPNTPQAQSLERLNNAMQPRFDFGTFRHIAYPVVGAGLGAAEGYFNPAEGQNPFATAGAEALKGGLEGAAVYGGGHALARARPGGPLNAARYAIGTGQPISTPTGDIGNLLLKLTASYGAGGQ